MLQVTASKVVAAAPERVWDLISDTGRYAEWVAGTDAVTRTDGPAHEGSTYDEVNPIAGPWRAKTRWTVIEYSAPRRQVHTSPDLPLSSRFEVVMEVEPDGDGSRVTMTLTGQPSMGPVGALFARAMKPMIDRDNRKSVEQFASFAERELAVPASA